MSGSRSVCNGKGLAPRVTLKVLLLVVTISCVVAAIPGILRRHHVRTLLQFEGVDLRSLHDSDRLRFHKSFDFLVPGRSGEMPELGYQCWRVWQEPTNDGVMVFQVKGMWSWRGSCAIRVLILSSNGKFRGSQEFTTGNRLIIYDLAFSQSSGGTTELCVRIRGAPITSPDISAKYYWLVGGKFLFHRQEDSKGGTVIVGGKTNERSGPIMVDELSRNKGSGLGSGLGQQDH